MQKVPGSKLQVPGEHLLSPDFFLLLCLFLAGDLYRPDGPPRLGGETSDSRVGG